MGQAHFWRILRRVSNLIPFIFGVWGEVRGIMQKLPRDEKGRIIPQGLNDQQALYCELYIKLVGNGAEAARQAGYKGEHDAHYRLSRNPLVAQRIRELQTKMINGELAVKALATLEQIMMGAAYPPAARVSAAKTVMEMAGHGIQAQGLRLRHGIGDEAKSLEEMSQVELEAFIMRQRAAMDSLEDVSRSVNAQVIELNPSESTNGTALLGQIAPPSEDASGHDGA